MLLLSVRGGRLVSRCSLTTQLQLVRQRHNNIAWQQQFRNNTNHKKNDNHSNTIPRSKLGIGIRGIHGTSTTTIPPNNNNTNPPRTFVLRANITPTQKLRNERIVQLGRQQDSDAIVELFNEEWDDFSLGNLATTVRSLDRSHAAMRNIYGAIALYLNNKTTIIDVISYSDIIHSIVKSNVRDESTWHIIHCLEQHEFAKQFVATADAQAISTVTWSLARMKRPDLMKPILQSILNHLQPATIETVLKWKPQGLANMAWACATLDVVSPMLFDAIDLNGDILVTKGNAASIHRTAWACAKLRYSSPTFFAAIDQRADWFLHQSQSLSEIADLAWACAKLGHASPNLFSTIEQHANILIGTAALGRTPPPTTTTTTINVRFHPTTAAAEVSKIAWACATLGHFAPAVFTALEEHSEWLVSSGNALSVANIAWACAKLQYKSPTIFASIEQRSEWLVSTSHIPQLVANTAWAFAKRKQSSPIFFAALEQRSDWIVSTGTPQDIASTAWACAKLGHRSPALFAAIDQRADWLVANGSYQAIANTAWACAMLSHSSPAFFDAVEKVSERIVSHGDGQTIAVTAWAFSKLGHSSPALTDATTRVSSGRIVCKDNNTNKTSSFFTVPDHGVKCIW